MHIMDLVENAIRAGADTVQVEVVSDPNRKEMYITVKDNGKGVRPEELPLLLDPFYTTKEGKKVGLGIPLFNETCKRCGGELVIKPNGMKGLWVQGRLLTDNIDLPPLGDLASAISGLMLLYPHVSISLLLAMGKEVLTVSTKDLTKVEDSWDAKSLLDLKAKIKEFLKRTLREVG